MKNLVLKAMKTVIIYVSEEVKRDIIFTITVSFHIVSVTLLVLHC